MGPQSYLVVLSFAAQLGSVYAWSMWGRAHGVPGGSAAGWVGAFIAAWLASGLVHQGGHAFVAWGCRLQVATLQVGPFVASRSDTGWRIRVHPNALAAPGFSPEIVTTEPNQPRHYLLWTAAAGPLACIVCGIVLRWAVVHLDWPFYALTWRFCGLTAAFATIAAVVNLIPYAGKQGEVSDGARVLALLRAHAENELNEATEPTMPTDVSPGFTARSSGLLSIASPYELNIAAESSTVPDAGMREESGAIPKTPILIGRSRRRSRPVPASPDSSALSGHDAVSENAVLAAQPEIVPAMLLSLAERIAPPAREARLNEDRHAVVRNATSETAPELTEAQDALLARLIVRPAAAPAPVAAPVRLPEPATAFALPFRAEFLATDTAEPPSSAPSVLRSQPIAPAITLPSSTAGASATSIPSAASGLVPTLRPAATSLPDRSREGGDESRTPRRRVIRIPSDQPVMGAPRAPFDPLALLRAAESS